MAGVDLPEYLGELREAADKMPPTEVQEHIPEPPPPPSRQRLDRAEPRCSNGG